MASDPWSFLDLASESAMKLIRGKSIETDGVPGSISLALAQRQALEDWRRYTERFHVPMMVTDPTTARRMNLYLRAFCIRGGSKYWQRRYRFISHRRPPRPRPPHPRFSGLRYFSEKHPIDGPRC